MKKETKLGRVFSTILYDSQPFAVLDGSSWKMLKTSSLKMNGWKASSGKFPKSGIMKYGKLYPQDTIESPVSVSYIEGKVSGLWPTPDAYNDPKSGGCAPWQKSWKTNKIRQIHLHHAVKMSSALTASQKGKVNLKTGEGWSETMKLKKTTGSLSPFFTAWLMGYPLDWTWPVWKMSIPEWLEGYLEYLISSK